MRAGLAEVPGGQSSFLTSPPAAAVGRLLAAAARRAHFFASLLRAPTGSLQPASTLCVRPHPCFRIIVRMKPGGLRLKSFGYALDAVMVVLTCYIVSTFRVSTSGTGVDMLTFVSQLPTSLDGTGSSSSSSSSSSSAVGHGLASATNSSSSIVTDLNALLSSPLSTSSVSFYQKWYNYLLGDDLGSEGQPSVCKECGYFHEMNALLTWLVLPAWLRESLPHMLACWMRNMLAGWLLYFIVGGAWAYWIYGARVDYHFTSLGRAIPSWEGMKAQIGVSASAMVYYSLAPTVGEWLAERGWTRAYNDVFSAEGGVGIVGYCLWTAAYLFWVEWGIYWAHRAMHESDFLYRNLHKTHVSFFWGGRWAAAGESIFVGVSRLYQSFAR